jgi:hypothetical protein
MADVDFLSLPEVAYDPATHAIVLANKTTGALAGRASPNMSGGGGSSDLTQDNFVDKMQAGYLGRLDYNVAREKLGSAAKLDFARLGPWPGQTGITRVQWSEGAYINFTGVGISGTDSGVTITADSDGLGGTMNFATSYLGCSGATGDAVLAEEAMSALFTIEDGFFNVSGNGTVTMLLSLSFFYFNCTFSPAANTGHWVVEWEEYITNDGDGSSGTINTTIMPQFGSAQTLQWNFTRTGPGAYQAQLSYGGSVLYSQSFTDAAPDSSSGTMAISAARNLGTTDLAISIAQIEAKAELITV